MNIGMNTGYPTSLSFGAKVPTSTKASRKAARKIKSEGAPKAEIPRERGEKPTYWFKRAEGRPSE